MNIYPYNMEGKEERESSNSEIQALKDFYFNLNGDLWTLNDNWNKGDPCLNHWIGVFCNKRGNIIGIMFYQNKLHGIINDSISNLIHLEFIHILNPIFEDKKENSNEIFYVSPKLFILNSLKEIVIKAVNLRQKIDTLFIFPSSTSSLEIIDFSHNYLTGELPDFSNLSKLKEINISNNGLSRSLSKLNTLSSTVINIQLQNNYFTGTLPNLNNVNSNLKYLDYRNNTIEGEVPSSYFSDNYFVNLEYVGLMLTEVNSPEQCKNIPFCIKKLFKNAQSINDIGFELTNNELQFLLPRA